MVINWGYLKAKKRFQGTIRLGLVDDLVFVAGAGCVCDLRCVPHRDNRNGSPVGMLYKKMGNWWYGHIHISTIETELAE